MDNLKKGKMKIFFGYAADVGKTFAMLKAAHEVSASGIDVVAGYISPHARPETKEWEKGLELIQTLSVFVEGQRLEAFNLDAALYRKPQIILVDELAGTNPRGCRHEKRYQDIRELLNAGIDVYTTLNVENLESLKDIISGITGLRIKERIADSIFDEASQVELIDAEPEELLKRGTSLTAENLIALRELALRRMADRVNILKGKSREGDYVPEGVAREHILVCLSSSPSNDKVIRQAARMANAFHAKFTAFYVESDDFAEMSEENRARLGKNIRLAEQLGAKVVTSYGSDIVEQIAEYSKLANISKIVLGRTYTQRSFFSLKDSFSDRLLKLAKLAPALEIFLVPDSYEKKYSAKKKLTIFDTKNLKNDIFFSALIMMVTIAVAFLFHYLNFSDANIIMVYLLSVLIISLKAKRRIISIVYSLICVFTFNFFFVEPVKTFKVNDTEYMITFLVMFLTALISSSMTREVARYAKQEAQKSYRTEILLETSQKLQKAVSQTEIVINTARQLGKLLEKNIYIFPGDPENSKAPYAYRHDLERETVLDERERAVAEWTFHNNKHAGFSTATFPEAKFLYLAVRSENKVFAVVGIDMNGKEIPAFEKDIMNAILNECALAIEKAELAAEQKEAAVKLKQEQLRADLLRSISHDLRTPLTSISGNAGMLIGNDDRISNVQRQEIYMDIYDDSMWLINLVENLLSVTRIEDGVMNLNLQPELVEDVIAEAMKHIDRKAVHHRIMMEQEDDMLVARMDAKLMMQVIINLVDNAIKYTPKGSIIRVSTKKSGKDIVISVSDDGNGIQEEQKEKLFDMFYTINNSIADGRRGMGLGLALCKSIVQAHGGKICVMDNIPKGTIFQFTLIAEEVKII